jgi:hypothetical protein
MGGLVRKGRIVAFGIAKALERRHLHEILRNVVIGHVATVPDGGPGRREESLGPFDPLDRIHTRRELAVEVLRQAVDLFDIETV